MLMYVVQKNCLENAHLCWPSKIRKSALRTAQTWTELSRWWDVECLDMSIPDIHRHAIYVLDVQRVVLEIFAHFHILFALARVRLIPLRDEIPVGCLGFHCVLPSCCTKLSIYFRWTPWTGITHALTAWRKENSSGCDTLGGNTSREVIIALGLKASGEIRRSKVYPYAACLALFDLPFGYKQWTNDTHTHTHTHKTPFKHTGTT